APVASSPAVRRAARLVRRAEAGVLGKWGGARGSPQGVAAPGGGGGGGGRGGGPAVWVGARGGCAGGVTLAVQEGAAAARGGGGRRDPVRGERARAARRRPRGQRRVLGWRPLRGWLRGRHRVDAVLRQ